MAILVPDIWLEVTSYAYPANTPTVWRLSTKAMAWPTFILGLVVRDGWSDIVHALSDWQGNAEASPFSARILDVDGTARALAETIGISVYNDVEAVLYLLSETARRAGSTKRPIFRGYLTAPPVPGPRRTATLPAADVLGRRYANRAPEDPIQTVFYTSEWLENTAGLVNVPQGILGKPVNIVVGEHTDEGALDANGDSAAKGMLPADLVGSHIITDSNTIDTTNTNVETVPPPVLDSAALTSGGGPRTYTYAVSAIFEGGGETTASNAISVDGCPEELDDVDKVELSWSVPSGWETYYEEHCIGFRILGRTTDPPTRYLDINRHALTGDGFPDWTPGGLGTEYADDGDHDVEKDPGAPAVGTATVVTTVPGDPTTITTSTEWGLLVWALGYCEMTGLYGSDGADGTPPKRVLIDPDDPDIITPASASWPHPDPWVELDYPGGGTVRVSAFYARGVRLTHHRDGDCTFAVNGCGVTDTGDDGGTPITEMGAGWVWVLNELILKNGGEGYRTGAFWPLEEFADGTTIVSTSTVDAAQAATAGFIGGLGYQFHLALTEPCTFSQFQAWFNTTFNCYSGTLDNGQAGIWVIDDGADPAAGPALRQRIEIDGPLPDPTIAEDEVENFVSYRYDWDPDAQAFRSATETVEDDTSKAIYGLRTAADEFLELRCTRDRTTARDAMARRLFHNKVAPIYQPLPISLLGIEIGLGTLVRVTHEDGLGTSGYADRPFFVVRKQIRVNEPGFGVTLVARDVYRVYTVGLSALADEGSMTGNLGDETSTAPPPSGAFELLGEG